MKLKIIILIICLFLITSGSWAATLNVPATYATIALAINAASAGDTVLVANGTYGTVTPTDGKHGNMGNPIIVKAANQYGASVTTFNFAPGASGVYYIRVDGFLITGSTGVYVNGPGTEIINCKFTGDRAEAISIEATSQNLAVTNNWFYQVQFCIDQSSWTFNINGAVISGNRIQDLHQSGTPLEADGFRIVGTGITISDNYAYDMSFIVDHDDFIQCPGGTGLDNSTVKRNIVNGLTFIMANPTLEGSAWITGNTFKNNVRMHPTSSKRSSGMFISRGQNNLFYNNTIANSVYGIYLRDYISGGNKA